MTAVLSDITNNFRFTISKRLIILVYTERLTVSPDSQLCFISQFMQNTDFFISWLANAMLFIQCNSDCSCEHITGGVIMAVSLLAPVCDVCLFECDIKSPY